MPAISTPAASRTPSTCWNTTCPLSPRLQQNTINLLEHDMPAISTSAAEHDQLVGTRHARYLHVCSRTPSTCWNTTWARWAAHGGSTCPLSPRLQQNTISNNNNNNNNNNKRCGGGSTPGPGRVKNVVLRCRCAQPPHTNDQVRTLKVHVHVIVRWITETRKDLAFTCRTGQRCSCSCCSLTRVRRPKISRKG